MTPTPDDEARVAELLRAAAQEHELDRGRVWARIAEGIEEDTARGRVRPAPARPRWRRPLPAVAIPLAVAASAALVVTGVSVLRGAPSSDQASVVTSTAPQVPATGPSGAATSPVPQSSTESSSASSASSSSSVRSSTAASGSAGVSGTPGAGTGPAAPSGGGTSGGPGTSSTPPGTSSTAAGPPGPGTAAPSGSSSPVSGGSSGVTVSVRSVATGTTVSLAGGRPWTVAGATAAGGSSVTSSTFGVGPVQVNGTRVVRGDSPFRVSWQQGSPVSAGAQDSGWVVLGSGGSVPSFRVPLRPQGTPGSFTAYVATLGGGLTASTDAGGSATVSVAGCGAAICPYLVTVTVTGDARIDASLDLAPTGGGTLGIAAVRQD